eukprot:365659-Chlamydomonas_euryale.AAC.2
MQIQRQMHAQQAPGVFLPAAGDAGNSRWLAPACPWGHQPAPMGAIAASATCRSQSFLAAPSFVSADGLKVARLRKAGRFCAVEAALP